MIIFLYGKDGYRIKENVDKILEGYLKKNASGINIFKFSAQGGPASGWDDLPDKEFLRNLEETIKTMPFFEEKKIIITKNAFSSAAADKLPEIIEHWQIAKDQGLILVV